VKDAERTLIDRVIAGDLGAMDELFRAYAPPVFRFALHRLRNHDDAEDLTQEVFIRVMLNLSSFRGESTLLTWIFGIAHFLVLREQHGKHRRLELMSLDKLAQLGRMAEVPSPERADASRALERCARVLEQDVSASQRRIFRMMVLENGSMRSISAELGIGTGAVKSSVRNTRRILSRRAERRTRS